MSDINEKETMQYFMNGMKKARAAAKQLGDLNERSAWGIIGKSLDQIIINAHKLYTSKPQTRLQNLILADKIEKTTVH